MAADPSMIAALLDPSLATDQQALQRQMALAQMLRQESFSAPQAYGNSPISPLAVLAKALTGARATQMDAANDASRASLNQKMSEALRGQIGMLTGQQQPSGNGISLGGVSVPPAQTTSLGYSPSTATAMLFGVPGAEKLGEAELTAQQPTPEQKNARDRDIGGSVKYNLQSQNWLPIQKLLNAQQQDPSNPALAEAISKENYIAPVDAKPGTPVLDPRTYALRAYAPKAGEGINISFGRDQGGALVPTAANEIPGYAKGAAGVAGPVANAEAAGKAPFQLVQTYNPSTQAPETGYAGSLLTPPGGVKLGGPVTPRPQASPQAAPQARPSTVQTGPGLGAAGQVEGMQKRWGELQSQAGNATATSSYLQSIKQLADKAAVGPFTDRLQFTNALLSLVGSEKATDATTANALLDKYSNQIVSRLGSSGGLATDSARQILQAAYPNAHMTKEAIREAADNIIGAQDMLNAKARLLIGPANKRDAEGYTQLEQRFDQAADPRVFQIARMDAKQAQAFLSKLPPDVRAELQRRAKALKEIGAF